MSEKSNFNNVFMLGVNFWPRSSGVRMWKNFDREEIDSAFAQVKAMGMDTVRVFPLWDDFQPIYELPGCGNIPRSTGFRHDWNVTPRKNYEMVDPERMAEFDILLDLAKKHQLKVIVALLTAWMSGTLFNPMWKNGRNLFSHPYMVKYQVLYCRAFARRYANRPEIIAWEYGNEQNCVDSCDSPETAWMWLHALAAELRLNDPATPVASGMHGLVNIPDSGSPWGIEEQADAVDLLTTHPYPPFTPKCFMDRMTDIRSNLHATAESAYVGDLGLRPVLCEETGTLGRSLLSEELTAAYLRLRLYSLFANGVKGCLWWCYSDFACKHQLPYRDVQMENDGLGLTAVDGRVKPAGAEMGKFRKVVDLFGGAMPEMARDTAILVSDLDNNWPAAYNAYVLCIQAGLAPRFVRPDRDDLTSYKLIIAPSFSGSLPCSVSAWDKVAEAVKNGSTLYASGNGVSFCNMEELFGISAMEKAPAEATAKEVTFHAGFKLTVNVMYRNIFHSFTSEATAFHADGTPAMVKNVYGKGTAYFLSVPLEKILSDIPYANEKIEAWKLYEELKNCAGIVREADCFDPLCERYWNSGRPGHGYLTVINHRREAVTLNAESPRKIGKISVIAGAGTVEGTEVTVEALQAVILDVTLV